MSGVSVPTLVETAVMKVAVCLHNDREISQWSTFPSDEVATAEWRHLMNSKVSKLFLPANLQKRTFEEASRVCLLILRVRAVYRESVFTVRSCQSLDEILKSAFVRTPGHLFDEQKTIEGLVRDERLDGDFRLTLATEFYPDKYLLPSWLSNDVRFRLVLEERKKQKAMLRYLHSDLDFYNTFLPN
ncbi:unnamed protein product, partial [Larinioides sclopetarius]